LATQKARRDEGGQGVVLVRRLLRLASGLRRCQVSLTLSLSHSTSDAYPYAFYLGSHGQVVVPAAKD